ncbi:DUF2163 domain-containing protein [soil metagenome]
MRTLPAEMVAALESGAATLCTAWILQRADGVRLGFTDHDRPLSVEGVTCSAASGWTAGAAEGELGFAPGTASTAGVLTTAAVTEADIAAGAYDGATVEAWRVDWTDPATRLLLWRATVRRLVRSGDAFTVELEGPLAALKRTAGRLYGRTCDASLGDGRCGVDLAAFPGATCDKRWATCTGAFANGANFQGFPDIPGDDFLTVYAGSDGGPRDGGSRR